MILLCRLFDKGRKGIFVRISFDRRRQSVAGDLHEIQLRVFFLKICLVCMRRDRRRRRKTAKRFASSGTFTSMLILMTGISSSKKAGGTLKEIVLHAIRIIFT